MTDTKMPEGAATDDEMRRWFPMVNGLIQLYGPQIQRIWERIDYERNRMNTVKARCRVLEGMLEKALSEIEGYTPFGTPVKEAIRAVLAGNGTQ